jgi:hypothetical protein
MKSIDEIGVRHERSPLIQGNVGDVVGLSKAVSPSKKATKSATALVELVSGGGKWTVDLRREAWLPSPAVGKIEGDGEERG